MDGQIAVVVDPRNVEDPALREIAIQAAVVTKLEDTYDAILKLGATTVLGPDDPDYYEEIEYVDDLGDVVIEMSRLGLWQMIPHDVAMELVED